jgi:peptidoglycan biosynthesis protein MviN/MurJ (putative lipid II flippase)
VGAAALLLLRAFLQMLFLLAPLENYRVSALPLAARRALLDGLRPALSAAAIFKMGPLVDRALASHLGPGAISLLNFLQQVYGTLLGVADRIFSPRLIAKVADARSSVMGVRELLQWHQRVVWGLAALALLGGLVLIWILPCIVGFFAHHPLSLDMHVLAGFFAIFLVAGVVGLQSASLLYGSNLSRVVFRVALINFLISILVRLMGMQYAGFYGLVAGIVLYQFLNAVVLSRDAGRHIGESVK